MSVASHLAISPAKYDARIRSLIPLYDELIAEVARALGHAARPVRTVVDLGIGTGALARACLESATGARVWGIDADPDMMAIARIRLGRLSRRVTMATGSFLDETLPPCDAIVASYSLHHIRTTRAKLAFYRRCYQRPSSRWRPDQRRLRTSLDTARIRARSRHLVHPSREDVRQPRAGTTGLRIVGRGGHLRAARRRAQHAETRRLCRGRAVAPLTIRGHRRQSPRINARAAFLTFDPRLVHEAHRTTPRRTRP